MNEPSAATRAACEAITKSDHPSLAIKLAFDASNDRKSIIRIANRTADDLRSLVLRLFASASADRPGNLAEVHARLVERLVRHIDPPPSGVQT